MIAAAASDSKLSRTPAFGIVPNLNPASGGIYQYSLLMLQALQARKCRPTVLFTSSRDAVVPDFLDPSVEVAPLLPETSKLKLVRALKRTMPSRSYEALRAKSTRSRSIQHDPDRINPRPAASRYLRECGVDFMLYPAPTPLAFETDLPFAITIHDLHHRITPEFPEVGEQHEWLRREYLFRNAAREASLIWTESEAGKNDVLRFYGDFIDTPDRIRVLPLIAAPYLQRPSPDRVRQVREKYGLSAEYFFYPAQFWPHKNHNRLVSALARVRDRFGLRQHLVLTGGGSDDLRRRTQEEVLGAVEALSLQDRVHVIGYVDDEDIAALYVAATSLVMPTFFGPTNIPVVEAWSLGCPVVASRLSGAEEQVGDAALLVDPSSVEDLAEAMAAVATKDDVARHLVQRGAARLGRFTFDDFATRVQESLSWGTTNMRRRGFRTGAAGSRLRK